MPTEEARLLQVGHFGGEFQTLKSAKSKTKLSGSSNLLKSPCNSSASTSKPVDALGGSETPPNRAKLGGFQTLKTATVENGVAERLELVPLLDLHIEHLGGHSGRNLPPKCLSRPRFASPRTTSEMTMLSMSRSA